MSPIWICSRLFGNGAEGKCTARLVEGLAHIGVAVGVVTAGVSYSDVMKATHRHITVPLGPPMLQLWLRRFQLALGIPAGLQDYVWWTRVSRLVLPERPTLVYGRAQPVSSLFAAEALAHAHRASLAIHLSDPLPSPWGTESSLYRRRLRTSLIRLTDSSQLITFSTKEAVAYEGQLLGLSPSSRTLVLPHIAPAPSLLPTKASGQGPVFLYTGSFYGPRRPEPLIDAFRIVLSRVPAARLRFVGPGTGRLARLSRQYGLGNAVECFSSVENVESHIAESSVLVSIDAFVPPIVFLPSKLVEYLAVNRPIVVVTPQGSPADRLIAPHIGRTAVAVNELTTEAIADGFLNALSLTQNGDAFRERFADLARYSSSSIARLLKAGLAGAAR